MNTTAKIESRYEAMRPFWAAERAALANRAALRRIAREHGLKKHFPRAGWAWDLEAAAKIAAK